jgi:DNA-binding HxlR family transcriptional regulator
MLEARGFVYRKYEATIPPAVTYGLTSRMGEMRPVLEQLDRLAGILVRRGPTRQASACRTGNRSGRSETLRRV